MQPADLAPRAFSTVGLPAARRVELWETHNATALIGLDVQASEPLVATELNVRLPLVNLARVSGSAHMVHRTKKVIERIPDDAIAVYMTLRGDAWFGCADRTHTLRPSNVLICETNQPFVRGFRHGLEELVVKVDRAVLPEVPRLGRPVITCFRNDGPSDQYARALARIASQTTRISSPLPPDENTVLNLVAVLVAGRAAAPATAHRAAARSYIEEHLTNPRLGADQVATAIGISERQLSRIFAADGTSIPRHILSRRLDLAYSVLVNAADGNQIETVADIAAQCGFTSAAYFSHAFRQHFRHRASDTRGSASSVTAAPEASPTDVR